VIESDSIHSIEVNAWSLHSLFAVYFKVQMFFRTDGSVNAEEQVASAIKTIIEADFIIVVFLGSSWAFYLGVSFFSSLKFFLFGRVCQTVGNNVRIKKNEEIYVSTDM